MRRVRNKEKKGYIVVITFEEEIFSHVIVVAVDKQKASFPLHLRLSLWKKHLAKPF
jgi:hypothetical protein